MTELLIQHLVFEDEQTDYAWELFYRGERSIVSTKEDGPRFLIGAYHKVDFSTYFNSVSLGKWKLYTDIQSVFVNLDIRGEFDLKLCGLSMQNGAPTRRLLKSIHHKADTRSCIREKFPECGDPIVYIEICSYSPVELYSGSYSAEFEREEPKPVEMAIATTTCWKEDYIKPNVALLHKTLLVDDADIRDHLTIHIVDNGRSLSDDDFPTHPRIHLHPNPNVGGSGGFARGMLEAKRQEPAATHVLLMDDDVKVMPDSIYRTYVLLQTRREEYDSYFIGGAMMLMEDMTIQHEDIGTLQRQGAWIPLKRRYNHRYTWDIIDNEKPRTSDNEYQGWWYCCIPMEVVNAIGLPLPIFVRTDDVEYSIRAKSKIMTMNAIAIWHPGFQGKYVPSMDVYQAKRNLFIANAIEEFADTESLFTNVQNDYRLYMYKHNYDAAESCLRVLEDFLKGPSFVIEENSEKVFRDARKLNPKMIPLEEISQTIDVSGDPYWDYARPRWKRWLAKALVRLTYNGNRFCPKRLLKIEVVPIPFDYGYTPHKMSFRKTMVGVNVVNQTGCIYEIDRNRFKELHRRYKKAVAIFRKNYDRVARQYQEQRAQLTSDEFWWEYLEEQANNG